MTPCRVTHTSRFALPLLTGTYTNVPSRDNANAVAPSVNT